MYPNLSYIDLHCDTAYELYHRNAKLEDGVTAVSLPVPYDHYAQFFAVWSDKRLDDEACYRDFLAISDRLAQELNDSSTISAATTFEELNIAWTQHRHTAFLSVEDARLLAGDLSRLDVLYARGVRALTLVWKDESCIGGAWNTETGLTDFGREVIRRCFELGILVDISHASEQTADEVLTMAEHAGKSVLATHSNAYAVYPHPRNLRDEQFRRLIALGGIVGMNLCAFHIAACEQALPTPEDLLRHVDHFLSLDGEQHIAIGGDLDGATLPCGIEDVSDVARLADCMAAHGYSDFLIRNIFYENAQRFIARCL